MIQSNARGCSIVIWERICWTMSSDVDSPTCSRKYFQNVHRVIQGSVLHSVRKMFLYNICCGYPKPELLRLIKLPEQITELNLYRLREHCYRTVYRQCPSVNCSMAVLFMTIHLHLLQFKIPDRSDITYFHMDKIFTT